MSDQTWVEPGAFAVAPGVYRIPLSLPMDELRAVNVYALVDGPQVVLIDAGWALEDSAGELARSLAPIGIELADIGQFLVTHTHRDHYTQAVAVRRMHGTRVSTGRRERESLLTLVEPEGVTNDPWDATVRRLVRSGAPELAVRYRAHSDANGRSPYWELPDQWLADGDRIEVGSRSLRVLETPGHTRGHVVFSDDTAAVLFAGDHVLPHITPSIGLEPRPGPSPLADYLESLALMLTMPDAVLLPAHGPVSPSVHARVAELLAHHDRRLDEIIRAVEAGGSTAADVAARLRWTRRQHSLNDLDTFNSALAVCETLAHLDVLTARGQLVAVTAGEVAVFSPIDQPVGWL